MGFLPFNVCALGQPLQFENLTLQFCRIVLLYLFETYFSTVDSAFFFLPFLLVRYRVFWIDHVIFWLFLCYFLPFSHISLCENFLNLFSLFLNSFLCLLNTFSSFTKFLITVSFLQHSLYLWIFKNFIWSYQIYFKNLVIFFSPCTGCFFWIPFITCFALCLVILGRAWIFQSGIITCCAHHLCDWAGHVH